MEEKYEEQWSKIGFRFKQRLQQCLIYDKKIFIVNYQMQTYMVSLSISSELISFTTEADII